MDQPFFEIYIKNMIHGDTVVYWGLERGFNDTGPYYYRLQWAETSTGDWVDVDTGPLIDVFSAVDSAQHVWAKELETYYRIILTTQEGVYTSFPQQASGTWNKREWLVGRDICRKEWLRLTKQVGVEGWLLKRKICGAKCNCVDWDNPSDSGNSSCTTCFGTGIVGGYWTAVHTYVDSDLKPRAKEFDDTAGMKEDLVTKGRFFAYPHLATYDVFVEKGTDKRWIIRKVDNVAELRGQPLVYSAEMRLAAFTDPVYNVPLSQTPVSSSSEAYTPDYWTPSSSSSEIPVEEQCTICSDCSSSSSSASSSSSSSSSSAQPETCPANPGFPEGEWLWWDDCSESWVLGNPEAGNVWYTSQVDPGKEFPYLPTFSWDAVDGTLPAPTLTYVTGGFDVTDAGAWWMNGAYRLAGTHNGTYVYKGTLYSSSLAPE